MEIQWRNQRASGTGTSNGVTFSTPNPLHSFSLCLDFRGILSALETRQSTVLALPIYPFQILPFCHSECKAIIHVRILGTVKEANCKLHLPGSWKTKSEAKYRRLRQRVRYSRLNLFLVLLVCRHLLCDNFCMVSSCHTHDTTHAEI